MDAKVEKISQQLAFTITFWIRADKNKGWRSPDSDVKFPPATVKGGVMIVCVKYGTSFKVFILHPDIGFIKLVADVDKYLSKDAFVAVTFDGTVAKLYLNTEEVSVVDSTNTPELEVGDYVAARVLDNELKNVIKIGGNVKAILPAEVKHIDGDSLDLFFWQLKEMAKLPKERLCGFVK